MAYHSWRRCLQAVVLAAAAIACSQFLGVEAAAAYVTTATGERQALPMAPDVRVRADDWNPLSYCDFNSPPRTAPDGDADHSGPALHHLVDQCPDQPLICCIEHTVNDVRRLMQRRNITAVLDAFFLEHLGNLKSVLRTDLYRIGDILLRTIPQEFAMMDPIEMNLIRNNVQDIFCQSVIEFAQDSSEPLCHESGADTKAKANYILSGAYTTAAMTAMGYPNRMLSQQASRCVRAYTTRSYASYTRHVNALSCVLRSLQCQIKPALLALQSTVELFDRIRLVIRSPDFPGPRCKSAMTSLTVCPYCSGQHATPPCLSSCDDAVQVCLSEVMHERLHDQFLPVITNTLDRLRSIISTVSDSLNTARNTVHEVIMEANRDVVQQSAVRGFVNEIHQSCQLSHVLGQQQFEPQACNNLEPLVDYNNLLQKAIDTTQYLQHSFLQPEPYHAWSLCPKAAHADNHCRQSPPPPPVSYHREHVRDEDLDDFTWNVKDVMDLYLIRNEHLFNFVPAVSSSDESRYMYDDEDSLTQGSYLVVTENGSGGGHVGSGDGSGDGEGGQSGSGSGDGHPGTPDLPLVPNIKLFMPMICINKNIRPTIHAPSVPDEVDTTPTLMMTETMQPTPTTITTTHVTHMTTAQLGTTAAPKVEEERPTTQLPNRTRTKRPKTKPTQTPMDMLPEEREPASENIDLEEVKPTAESSSAGRLRALPALSISLCVLAWFLLL